MKYMKHKTSTIENLEYLLFLRMFFEPEYHMSNSLETKNSKITYTYM